MRFFTIIPLLLATISGALAAPIPLGDSGPSSLSLEKRNDPWLYRGSSGSKPASLVPGQARYGEEVAQYVASPPCFCWSLTILYSGGSGVSVTTDPKTLDHKYLFRYVCRRRVASPTDTSVDRSSQLSKAHSRSPTARSQVETKIIIH